MKFHLAAICRTEPEMVSWLGPEGEYDMDKDWFPVPWLQYTTEVDGL